jgi:integrase
MPEVSTAQDLYPQLIQTFFQRLQLRKREIGNDKKVTGVKASTIKTYYSKLVVFFRWLEHNNFVEKFTHRIVKPPNPKYEDERALNSEQVSKIIASINLNAIENEFVMKRDLLIISILIYTGIRRGELLGLNIEDVKLSEETLFINGKTSKSKNSRTIPLHPLLLLQIKSFLKLRKIRKSTSNALIVSTTQDSPLTIHGLKHWIEKYSRLSGVKFHIHQLRHTFACSLARTNVNIVSIMKTLGHTNIYTTQGYLRSITSEQSKEAIEQLFF